VCVKVPREREQENRRGRREGGRKRGGINTTTLEVSPSLCSSISPATTVFCVNQ